MDGLLRRAGLAVRTSLEEPWVRVLADEVSPGTEVVDLGGCLSLNVHLVKSALVLRIHQPFVSAARIRALQRLRQQLAAAGLTVGEPRTLGGSWLRRCGDRWAELETFQDHTELGTGWSDYCWMYAGMGRLHRHLSAPGIHPPPRPFWSTYAPPGSLRRWLGVTRGRVHSKSPAGDTVHRLATLIGRLRRHWVSAAALPQQLIHGDVRRVNMGRSPAGEPVYLDFGFAAVRPRVHDLAYCLSWIVLRPDGGGRAENFDWSRARELIEAYETGASFALTATERRALPAYLAAIPLYSPSIAGYLANPAGNLTDAEDLAFIDISDWVLANYDLVLDALSPRS